MRATFLALLLLALSVVRAGHPISHSDTSWPNLPASNPLLDGLIHAWMLTEGGTNTTSPDRVGSATLTFHNGASWTTNGGQVGVLLNKMTSDYMDTPSWAAGQGTNMTFVVWCDFPTDPGGAVLLCKAVWLLEWTFYFNSELVFHEQNTMGGSGSFHTGSLPTTNTWHQFVVTYPGTSPTSNAHLYIDTVETGSFTGFTDIPIVDTTSVLTVGRRDDGMLPFGGIVGPIYIYTRQLNTNEIASLYSTKYLFSP